MPGALQQTVLPYLGVMANARAWSGIGCVRPVSPAVEGERCSARDGGQCCGGVGHGVRGRPGRIGPVQPGALVRLQVGWLALPPDGGEEEADARLTFGAAVMNDVTEG